MNASLESAFEIIKSLLKEKDMRIRELEDENLKLRNKLSEIKESYREKGINNCNNNNCINENKEYKDNIIISNDQDNQLIDDPNSFKLMYSAKNSKNVTPVVSKNKINIVPFTNNNSINNRNPNFQPHYKVTANMNMISINENNLNYNYNTNDNTGNNSPNPHYNALKNHSPNALSPTPISEKASSNMNDSTTSRNEVKNFLHEVKEKIPSKEFKEFINFIKILTDKSQVSVNRKEIFENVKTLFGSRYKDLYVKFEMLLSIKK